MKNKGLAYKIVAFTAGFVLMIFELVAARLLAPTIGASIFVWTSVIGVIMAALALGYWYGGRVADQRNNPLDIVWLLLAASAGIVFVLMAGSLIIDLSVAIFKDARWQGLTAALLLFALPSFILGMVSPYLAKMAITSTETSGSSVANLSAMNAIGSILGTFLTGFVLFGLIGGDVTLALLVALSAGISWLLVTKDLWEVRLVFSIALVVVAGFLVWRSSDSDTITIDTATARYLVVSTTWEDRDITALLSGPHGIQSAVFTDGSGELVFWYQHRVAEVFHSSMSDIEAPPRILILGGGAFNLPDYFARQYPDSTIDVVEIDPKLQTIAEKHFGFVQHDNINIYGEDARSFVRSKADTKQYDFIMVDVSKDIAMPWQFVTREFGDRLNHLLDDQGVIVVNLIGAQAGNCSRLFDAVYGIYARHLPNRYIVQQFPGDHTITNIELIFSRRALTFDETSSIQPLQRAIGRVYTDRFAPIEHMLLQCKN
ncbi:fused MFS/spermidine synthase [Candidatus Saccharibacteria bacterium]|nr:fused MFS/spermidine synthase [Candidatus Saccharibacteria bacterium]